MKTFTVSNQQQTEIIIALENHIQSLERRIAGGYSAPAFTLADQRNFLNDAKAALVEVERKCPR